jgi:hypothetical protein
MSCPACVQPGLAPGCGSGFDLDSLKEGITVIWLAPIFSVHCPQPKVLFIMPLLHIQSITGAGGDD